LEEKTYVGLLNRLNFGKLFTLLVEDWKLLKKV